jgi:L-asparaginase
MDAKKDQKIVVLATGGTIAGVAGDVSKPNQYVSGQLNVSELTQNLVTHGVELVQEQVFNIDSKDMQFSHWQTLLGRCNYWLRQNDVAGLIVTHGTDTLEETAFFLQTVLRPTKPVAMTCAMFPANVPQSDGPKNLQDALNWVLHTTDLGIHLVCAGEVFIGIGVQKIYSDRTQAFASRDAHSVIGKTPLAQLGWSAPTVEQVLSTKHWPRVEIVLNHAGADGQFVRTLIESKAPNTQSGANGTKLSKTDGIIVAGTGSGTLSQDLEKALLDAQKAGIWMARVSRCAFGAADPEKHPNIPALLNLSPVQARVAMILGLLAHHATD